MNPRLGFLGILDEAGRFTCNGYCAEDWQLHPNLYHVSYVTINVNVHVIVCLK